MKWIKKFDKLNLSEYKEYSKKGLILEFDLKYPKMMHDMHNEYPLAAEKRDRGNPVILLGMSKR